MAEQRIGQVVIGRPEIGVVEDIEELRPEPQVQLLGERKLPLECYIRLRSSKTPQHIAAEIALRSGRRFCKGSTIETLAAGILRAIEHKWHTGHDVRSGIEGGTSRTKIRRAGNIDRRC